MDNIEKLCQKAPIEERRCGRWVAMLLGCVLLFFTQATVSAKTLLEQYLNCDGIEEFAFSHEFIENKGEMVQFFFGSCQNENFLLLHSKTLLNNIPKNLEDDPVKIKDAPLSLMARFGCEWNVIQNDHLGYLREIWFDQNIVSEQNNQVQLQCINDINFLNKYLLNFGLDHVADASLSLNGGKYTNELRNIVVSYSMLEKINDLSFQFFYRYESLNNQFLPANWKTVITLTNNGYGLAPVSCILFVCPEDEDEQPFERIVISKLIPAKNTLTRNHFLRPEFEKIIFEKDGYPTTFQVSSNRLVGLDSQSNWVVRMESDDPHVLTQYDMTKLIFYYWITASVIAIGSILCFIRCRNEKSNNIYK